MKMFFIAVCSMFPGLLLAQSTTQNIINGGRTLVELITLLKPKAKPTGSFAENTANNDSCMQKQKADLCFKNSSNKDLVISLYKRTDTGYEAQPFTMKVITLKQECWYELRSGIYKYKIELDIGNVKTLVSEGELKLQPCDNMQREITE
jgi:hypothetical protein